MFGGYGYYLINSGKKFKYYKKYKKFLVGYLKIDFYGGQFKFNFIKYQFYKLLFNKLVVFYNFFLMSIKLVKVLSLFKSSMIEFINLFKMIVLVYYIKKIIFDQNVQKNSRNGFFYLRGRNMVNREYGGRLFILMGIIGR